MMGFSRESLVFLEELRANNDRQWFNENKKRSEDLLFSPARDLVVELGDLLRAERPNIIADPRVNRSLYRINRDTRFSRDKTPYKTQMALWWWEGLENRLECPGFYFHLSPEGFGLSVGCYRFSEKSLLNWRAYFAALKNVSSFNKLTKIIEKTGHCFKAPDLKRVPAAYSSDHPGALWLKYKGFYTWNEEFSHPDEILGSQAAEYLFERFVPLIKLHVRLLEILES